MMNAKIMLQTSSIIALKIFAKYYLIQVSSFHVMQNFFYRNSHRSEKYKHFTVVSTIE